MSVTSDLNFMDLLFDKEDPSLGFGALEKDDLAFKSNFDADLKSTFDLTVSDTPILFIMHVKISIHSSMLYARTKMLGKISSRF